MIADLVAKLIASGTPADVAAMVVAEAFAAGVAMHAGGIPQNSADVSAERRRERDRNRKRLAKEIPQNSAEKVEIPQNSRSASLSSNSEHQETKESKRGANRGNRLPENWFADQADWNDTINTIGLERAQGELAKFRDHWKQQPGSKGVKLDWSAAWRNWIRRAAEYGGKNGQPTGANRTAASAGSAQTGADSILAGMGRLAARNAERKLAERSGDREGEPGFDLADEPLPHRH